MTDAAEKLKPVLDALTYDDREDLRDYLATHDEVAVPLDALSEKAKTLLDQLFELYWEEQVAIGDILRAENACPPGVLSDRDPNFWAIIEERVRRVESGEAKCLPAEEVMRKLREKYG